MRSNKKGKHCTIEVLGPFMKVESVFGAAKFNVKEKRIAQVSSLQLLHSSIVMIALVYLVYADVLKNNDLLIKSGTYYYFRSVLKYLTPIQYVMISALTHFFRYDQCSKLCSNMERLAAMLDSKSVNVPLQIKQNLLIVSLILIEFVGQMVLSVIQFGFRQALDISYSLLMHSLEDVELCSFFAAVRALGGEVGRLRAEVRQWYGGRAFVVTLGRRGRCDFMEAHITVVESYHLLVELYSIQFVVTVSSALVYCLIIIQMVIEDVFKGNTMSWFPRCVMGYWFLRNLARLFVISTACSHFQRRVDALKRTLVDQLVSGQYEARGEVAALLRVVQSAGAAASVYELFQLDNKLPFKLLSLLATYTIVLVQFANV